MRMDTGEWLEVTRHTTLDNNRQTAYSNFTH